MRLRIVWLLTLVLFSSRGNASDHRKTTQRIGDLTITLLGSEEREARRSSDHHTVAVLLRAENVGKQALCVRFRSTLKTTFALKYQGSSFSSSYPLQVNELLPGEKTEGEYEFLVKNGVEPLEFDLALISQTQSCGGAKDSFSAMLHASDELKFDLTKPSDPSSAETPVAANGEELATSSIRVFLTVAKGGATQATAMKSFSEHCPQLQLTTEKEGADYVVELTPSSFKQSKNAATVTNREGDVIYSGATFNLGNAAKDACGAILSRPAVGKPATRREYFFRDWWSSLSRTLRSPELSIRHVLPSWFNSGGEGAELSSMLN
jgi:hypothetical protein